MLIRLARGGAAGLLAVFALHAPQPGWRITQSLSNVTIGGLWAGGADDAWLAGDDASGTTLAMHWNGTSWLTVKPPKAYTDSPLDQGSAAVTATSASNVWIAAARGTESVDYTDMLRWTGAGWAKPVRLNSAIQAAVAPSATQLWAFGTGDTLAEPNYVAHLTGTTWTSGSFPLNVTTTAALSSSDVWAGGTVANGLPGFEHWTGSTWQATPVPDLGLTASHWGSGQYYVLDLWVIGMAAVAPDDVWANITTIGGNGTYLLHWNGTAWSRVAFPYAGSFGTSVTPDGNGGLWLVLQAPDRKQWFCHYSAGRWTRTLVPGSMAQEAGTQFMAWIPGTDSQWEVSGVSSINPGRVYLGTEILKYGR
jgi:hypothetical protein